MCPTRDITRCFTTHGYGPPRSISTSWFDSITNPSQPRRLSATLAGMYPRSVTMPIFTPSARKVKPTGSAASCGMVKGATVMSPMVKLRPDSNVSSLASSGRMPSFFCRAQRCHAW